jgi:hypothetical protein
MAVFPLRGTTGPSIRAGQKQPASGQDENQRKAAATIDCSIIPDLGDVQFAPQ